MTTIVKTRVVKIGNSQGIRIPKVLLDQVNFSDEVELEVDDGQIVVRSSKKARAGWEEQFELMAQAGDDELLDGDVQTTSWDDDEWEW